MTPIRYTLAETAAMLGYSTRQVRQFVRDGLLVAEQVKPGGKLFFSIEAIEAFRDACRVSVEKPKRSSAKVLSGRPDGQPFRWVV